MFDDNEFTEACAELDNPDIADWEFFTESHDVKIYRLYNETTGLYSYKIYGQLKAVEPEVCAQVYMDMEYRKIWDSYCEDVREVTDGDQKFMYWQVNFPFPLWNRDYVFVREMRQLDLRGCSVWVVLAKAAESPQLVPTSGVVRVTEFVQSIAMTSDKKNGTRAFMRYYDNPGGNIPTWLINWAAKKGVPAFLTEMQKACYGYQDYLKKKESSR